MIKKLFKYTFLSILTYLIICFITPFNKYLRHRSIENQISYLDQIMKAGYDDKLQEIFPEGKMFSNAIFTLSIIEFCETNHKIEKKYTEIIEHNIKRILSKEAKEVFHTDMEPKYGIFYNGWTNYVLRKYQESALFKFSTHQQKIQKEAFNIQKRILNKQKDTVTILDSYNDANWPADNLIGLLSLKQKALQKKWLDTLLLTTQHQSGLIHHSGSYEAEIRGSSQAMMSFCLQEIDYEKKEQYNATFKNIFVDDYWGIQLVKENENGSNAMDADSGPVILGYGGAASIMNIKTQASYKDSRSKKTWAFFNTIALPMNIFGQKYYLFKQEPMFDVFMLWASVELE